MKNNFIQYTLYTDETCGTPETILGQLVNTCYNEQSKSTGAERSYLVKVNKKENLLVELEYEGSNCRGIPSKVTNLMGDAFPGWSTCSLIEFDDDDDDDDDSPATISFTVDYVSTYPSLGSGNYVYLTSPAEYCSSTENKNYNTYYITPLNNVGFDWGCQMFFGSYYMYSNSSCGTNGQVEVTYYSDAACSTPVSSFPIFEAPCAATDDDYDDDDDDDDDGDDDDDDDDDDYDDDYVETGVVETEKCT